MTRQADNGGAAFPVSLAVAPSGDVYHSAQVHESGGGMSLRDWFAGRFFPAVMLDYETFEEAARASYEAADAMLTARKESPNVK